MISYGKVQFACGVLLFTSALVYFISRAVGASSPLAMTFVAWYLQLSLGIASAWLGALRP